MPLLEHEDEKSRPGSWTSLAKRRSNDCGDDDVSLGAGNVIVLYGSRGGGECGALRSRLKKLNAPPGACRREKRPETRDTDCGEQRHTALAYGTRSATHGELCFGGVRRRGRLRR